jgi:hypothetical protein
MRARAVAVSSRSLAVTARALRARRWLLAAGGISARGGSRRLARPTPSPPDTSPADRAVAGSVGSMPLVGHDATRGSKLAAQASGDPEL